MSESMPAQAARYLEQTARMYDEYTRSFVFHRETSRDLVAAAGLEPDMRVVDLACGTGVTTEEILRRLDGAGRVVGVDMAAEMLDVARERVPDARVRWVHCRGEEMERHVEAPADAVVCNSALWLMDIPSALRAARQTLRAGGHLAFNLPDKVVRIPGRRPERPDRPTLLMLMQAIAILEHGCVPPLEVTVFELDHLRELLGRHGFAVEETTTRDYEMPPAADHAYFSIPPVSRSRLPGLPYRTRMEILRQAYARCDTSMTRRPGWLILRCVAVDPPDSSSPPQGGRD